MEFAIDVEGPDRVLHLSGQLTFRAQVAGEKALERLFGASAERYVVDLSALDSIDSVGLGLLAVARELGAKENSPVVLRHPNDIVTAALKLARYQDMFVLEA